jgi:hypothetical protein
MYVMEKMRPDKIIPGIWGEEDRGEWWKRGIQV